MPKGCNGHLRKTKGSLCKLIAQDIVSCQLSPRPLSNSSFLTLSSCQQESVFLILALLSLYHSHILTLTSPYSSLPPSMASSLTTLVINQKPSFFIYFLHFFFPHFLGNQAGRTFIHNCFNFNFNFLPISLSLFLTLLYSWFCSQMWGLSRLQQACRTRGFWFPRVTLSSFGDLHSPPRCV